MRTSQAKPIVISKLNSNFKKDSIAIKKVNQDAQNEYGSQVLNLEDIDAKKKKIQELLRNFKKKETNNEMQKFTDQEIPA